MARFFTRTFVGGFVKFKLPGVAVTSCAARGVELPDVKNVTAGLEGVRIGFEVDVCASLPVFCAEPVAGVAVKCDPGLQAAVIANRAKMAATRHECPAIQVITRQQWPR